ncbi:NAD(P)H-hydrate dehydratase [Fulvivirga sedimenti]|uniref:Bifunctional NAD(P)H-hydrate repair enzyme n=1 Tax=Fulvivirga sedimenti TaxID=2879465 RepID=A0A9X1HNE8_9BACT|nr:NAD(P)H-hydrate dehydratase [Fulvivirga sedimenti]MCA6074018.1 NAD(P)H-hydrate dehydratase [Fulvivirga sedimenti]
MKVFTAEQIREADAHTIRNEPVTSIGLMERAARAIFQWMVNCYDPSKRIAVVCGTGNNGGDGLAVSRMLHEHGYRVDVYVINRKTTGSDDFETNLNRLPVPWKQISESGEIPSFEQYGLIIDAIFGTGLSRAAEGIYAESIRAMNDSSVEILAIDLPSGLFPDASSAGMKVVHATVTLTFQLPKLALLMPENGRCTGEWEVLDIGLDQDFISSQHSPFSLITAGLVDQLIPARSKFDHKGNYGHGIIIAGSHGKIGAAVLAARAALRSGIGLLTMYIPRDGYPILQSAVPEAMVITDENEHYLSGIPDLEGASAVGIGPGIGRQAETVYTLEEALRNSNKPMVLDADALNLLAEHPHLKDLVPENSILTPHPGEFRRLVGEWNNDFERLDKQRSLSRERKWIVVLKGSHTSVSFPDGQVFFNTTGNPGMATAGCGDVLTGVITSILAQGIKPTAAALCGVYIHGYAGDLAREAGSEAGLIAGDVVRYLPHAFAAFE